MALYGNMTLREREDKNRVRKRNEEKGQDSSDSKEYKKSKKIYALTRRYDKTSRAKYDEKGLEKDTGLDLCDCLEEQCTGCFINCPKCGSNKCGHECRCLRRYKYESAELEGYNVTIRSKHK